MTPDGTMLMAAAKIALRFRKLRRVIGLTSPSPHAWHEQVSGPGNVGRQIE
jgi:hypothetical protein